MKKTLKGIVFGTVAGVAGVLAVSAPCFAAETKLHVNSTEQAETEAEEDYEEFLNMLQELGIDVPDETAETDSVEEDTEDAEDEATVDIPDEVCLDDGLEGLYASLQTLNMEEGAQLIASLEDPENRAAIAGCIVQNMDNISDEDKETFIEFCYEYSLEDIGGLLDEGLTKACEILTSEEFWDEAKKELIQDTSDKIDEACEELGTALINVDARDIADVLTTMFK